MSKNWTPGVYFLDTPPPKTHEKTTAPGPLEKTKKPGAAQQLRSIATRMLEGLAPLPVPTPSF